MRAVVTRAWRRLVNLWRWSSVDRDLREEVEHHLEAAAAVHRSAGLDAESARRRAVREFGGERWLEASRSARGVPLFQDLVRDTRYALRSYRRRPGFALAVVIVMMLGIGASTAVFSVIRGVLLNPLPYDDPDALYTLLESDSAGALRLLSHPTFRDVADASSAVADLTYVRGEVLIVAGTEGTLSLLGAFVTPNFFDVMGREARAGRTFDAAARAEPVAVLSHRLATRLYGSADEALGRVLSATQASYTVIGVMPPGFGYPGWADMWLPIEALPAEAAFALEQRNLHVDSDVILRVRRAVTPERAAAVLGGAIGRVARAHPEPDRHFDRALLTPLRERVMGPNPPPYDLLFGAALLVLVLACINIAGLLLARGMARRGELAARLALGAGRGRLVRQLITESGLLALAGGAAGVLLAAAAIARLRRAAPTVVPRIEEVALDGGGVLFACVVTLLSAVVFGAFPALRATAGALTDAIRGGGRSTTPDRPAVRLRGALVVAQIALAVVLLVGASLLVRTARELGRQDLGFMPEGLIALRVMPPDQYGSDAARLALYERLEASLAAVPGVEAVALVNHLPLTRALMPTAVQTGRAVGAGENTLALFRSVSWNYLHTIGARPVRGRLYGEADVHGTGLVVNATLARREWGDADPVGQPITVYRAAQGAAGFGEPLAGHVLGVVADIREQGPDQPPAPAVYVPLERNVWTNIHLVVKTTRLPGTMIPALRAAVRDVEVAIPTAGPGFTAEFRPLDDYFAAATQTRTLMMSLLTAFAAGAVVLALTGLFALLAFVVTLRTREIGVRMALGASARDAAGLVIRQSGLLIGVGLLIGIAASVPATRLLEATLFGVGRFDVTSYAATCALFLAAGTLAAWLPSRRAARVDPTTALRGD